MAKRDLNERNEETERWNRMDHILRFISYSQSLIAWADMNKDLHSMYQGAQLLLDTITPDFDEPGENEQGKKIRLRGMKTKKFMEYRKLLDNAQSLNNKSNDPSLDQDNRSRLRNSAYKKLQTLKYQLLQECERLGYNARKSDSADSYRQGNN